MRVLLTGAAGQLGRAVQAAAIHGAVVVALDRDALDLTDLMAVQRTVDAHDPEVVINAGGYTAVDKAETDRERAYAVNAEGVGALARACARNGSRLIHVSTDFVFDGAQGRPYRPSDSPNPLSVYGTTKLAGEREIQATSGLDWRVIRTAWVYSATGRNFVGTILRLLRERDSVRVVADQFGTPTSAASLARCVWQAAADSGPSAILHYTDAGAATWYDFAVAVGEEALALGLLERAVPIVPITTAEYPTPARRPPFSVLDKTDTLARLALTPEHWRVELRRVLREMAS